MKASAYTKKWYAKHARLCGRSRKLKSASWNASTRDSRAPAPPPIPPAPAAPPSSAVLRHRPTPRRTSSEEPATPACVQLNNESRSQ